MKKTILCVLLAAVLALMPFAGMAAGEPVVMLAGKEMKPGDVLYCNSTEVDFSVENPTGHAEVSADGKTLTLNNFNNNDFCSEDNDDADESALIVYSPVTLNLQGQNRLSNPFPSGEGITMHGDTTIQGTGSLKIDANYGIFNWGGGSNLTITSGDVTIKGPNHNITADNLTISGGKVDLTSDGSTAMYASCDMTISGGEVNIKGAYAMIATGEMQLTGGKITLEYEQYAISANGIICTLPIPEGVEIRSIYAFTEMMDYTDNLDQITSDRWNPQWRTLQLPAQTAEPAAPASPAVPTTGDSTPIALWAALAVMSAAAMLVIRRRRSV